jgi:hypothetical protein
MLELAELGGALALELGARGPLIVRDFPVIRPGAGIAGGQARALLDDARPAILAGRLACILLAHGEALPRCRAAPGENLERLIQHCESSSRSFEKAAPGDRARQVSLRDYQLTAAMV